MARVFSVSVQLLLLSLVHMRDEEGLAKQISAYTWEINYYKTHNISHTFPFDSLINPLSLQFRQLKFKDMNEQVNNKKTYIALLKH